MSSKMTKQPRQRVASDTISIFSKMHAPLDNAFPMQMLVHSLAASALTGHTLVHALLECPAHHVICQERAARSRQTPVLMPKLFPITSCVTPVFIAAETCGIEVDFALLCVAAEARKIWVDVCEVACCKPGHPH